MRLIDLIFFIRTSSQMHFGQRFSDNERLDLIKLAFPRQDLIKWFDRIVPSGSPPERYMPLLLMTAASVLTEDELIGVRYGSEQDLALLRSCHGDPHRREIAVGPGKPSIADEVSDIPADRIGIVQGILERSAGTDGPTGPVAVARSALAVPAPHARRLCILPHRAFKMIKDQDVPLQGHLIYEGALQYWPGRPTSVILTSYIQPTA